MSEEERLLHEFDMKILRRASRQKWLALADNAGIRHSERSAARRLQAAGYLEMKDLPPRNGPPMETRGWQITEAGRAKVMEQ